MEHRPFLLGVAGGTGSGKSTVARRVLEAVGETRLALVEMDSYYRDVDWEHDADLLHHNFDHPSALDMDLLVEHLGELRRGKPIDVPLYDFVHHRRTDRTRPVRPEPVVIVEGILVLLEPAIRELLDFKIYVDTDADVRLIRRLRRDIEERGRSVEDVLRQYEQSVRPMHLEFVEPSKRWADVIIPEGGENTVALDMVVARVEKILGRL
ncbi:MAG TPA: uridine kinase [Thermoanaerobaculia bacterium]|nr:uridine kinase [Thermoanaerobaculia bacterium]